ncbi:MAG: hypothetical protein JNM17_24775 [Archangium sp.]|nr:hypothetical protein [Archangium sp.]
MRSLFVAVLLVASLTHAADFVLEMESGEASRDASSSTTTFTVKGTELTISFASEGRNADKELDPEKKTVTLKDPAKVDAALNAIRKSPENKKKVVLKDTRYQRGCLIEGKTKYCTTIPSADGTNARLTALKSLESLLEASTF